MKSILTLILFLFCFSATVNAEDNDDITSSDGYILVWHDEFNIDGAPNNQNWNFEEGYVRNEELQWYQPQNAWCRNGMLTITARRENRPNPNYNSKSQDWTKLRRNIFTSSSSITTKGKHEFLYGRFEIRARFSGTPGTWPSLSLLGSKYPWPSCGQIDLFTFHRYHGKPTILANVCWSGQEDMSEWDVSAFPISHFWDQDPLWNLKFHTWRLDWDPHYLRIYLDDQLLNETSLTQTINAPSSKGANDNPFETPMYIMINLALGSSGGYFFEDTLPTNFDVDYVRVFQKL